MSRTGDFVERWVRSEIRALAAYHVPDPGDLIKLDAMENPYRWPPEMVEAWLAVLRDTPVNRYPDSAAVEVKAALREAMPIPADADILLGNGSDELIQMIALAVAGEGRTVLAPEPSFVMYRMIGLFTGMDYVGVPLRGDDFALDMPAMLAAIEKHQPAVLFLAYPNNPTGNLWPESELRRLIEACPGLVVVDEAYAPFAGASLLAAVAEYPNLVVMRTVSKMGLAGLRLGLLVGATEWLSEFDKVRLPYNINVLTQVSARFALQHREVFDAQSEAICRERERLFTALQGMAGIAVYPSRANFLLFRVASGQAGRVFASLREQGVLIKNLHAASAQLSDCLRVTVGTPEENRRFLDALAIACNAL